MQDPEYFIVDVFTSTALTGNPLAVVFHQAGLSAERMLDIAREFNLSETTFVERRSLEQERSEGGRVRIFTTQEELPFAGHPTLGTAGVLRLKAPELLQNNELRLALKVGSIPVRFLEENSSNAIYGEMQQRDPEFGEEPDATEVARLTGLHEDEFLLPPRIVSTGTAFAIVPLRSADSLARLKVVGEEAWTWLRARGARWFYVLAEEGVTALGEPQWRARMQFHGGEDPATGSAAGCAIADLVDRGLVESGRKILIRQGIEIHRPSEIFASARRTDPKRESLDAKVVEIRVGGRTVPVANGRLFLP